MYIENIQILVVYYIAASFIAFVAYAIDKSAAKNNRSRIQESTLHMLALFGGWLGALLAQRVLRHKSKKAGYTIKLWASAIVNCAVVIFLCSTIGKIIS